MGNKPSLGGVFLFTSCHCQDKPIALGSGDYCTQRLEIFGLDTNKLMSYMLGPKTRIIFYELDNFHGKSWHVVNILDSPKVFNMMGLIGPVKSLQIFNITKETRSYYLLYDLDDFYSNLI